MNTPPVVSEVYTKPQVFVNFIARRDMKLDQGTSLLLRRREKRTSENRVSSIRLRASTGDLIHRLKKSKEPEGTTSCDKVEGKSSPSLSSFPPLQAPFFCLHIQCWEQKSFQSMQHNTVGRYGAFHKTESCLPLGLLTFTARQCQLFGQLFSEINPWRKLVDHTRKWATISGVVVPMLPRSEGLHNCRIASPLSPPSPSPTIAIAVD